MAKSRFLGDDDLLDEREEVVSEDEEEGLLEEEETLEELEIKDGHISRRRGYHSDDEYEIEESD